MTEQITASIFFGSSLTLLAYLFGNTLNKKYRKEIFNPILIAIFVVSVVLFLFNIDYDVYNNSAQYISYLLTPTTICLALPLYKQINILKENICAIFIGITAGVCTSVFSTVVLAKFLSLSSEQYITLLPKSITTALGLPLSEELGGIGEITVIVIILSGIFGNIFARKILSLAQIKSPVAKGIAIGTSSHAIGTTKAMEIGEIEGAISSLSIVLSGIMTVILIQYFV